jgi:hypothetical protein
MGKDTPQVFISYSRRDAGIAEKICKILERNNIGYFLDTKNINWGAKVNKDVRNALLSCTAIVVIISPASHKSQWVAYELGHAVALNKIILPLLSHPDIDVPQFIHELNYKTSLSEVDEFFSKDYPKLSQEQLTVNNTQANQPKKPFLKEVLHSLEEITDKSMSKMFIEALKYSLKETEHPTSIPSAEDIINKFELPSFALLNNEILLDSRIARYFLIYTGLSIDKNHLKYLLSKRNYTKTFHREPYIANGKNIFTYSEVLKLIGVKKKVLFVPNKLK